MKSRAWIVFGLLVPGAGLAEEPVVGAPPPAASVPRLEFAFEERVTIAPAVVMGDTALGRRQYIGITGGTVGGPKLQGRVVPGGFDFQLTYKGSDCTQLSADYFIEAEDGTPIHVFNEGLSCPNAERPIFRPRLEAPKGAHEWMTRTTFVATLDIEPPVRPAGNPEAPPTVEAVRIRFYQLK
ncbi:MAG TPA: DUF3237 family protein [Steroidobacteraceae bacterium]|jgi:hypothetical protein